VKKGGFNENDDKWLVELQNRVIIFFTKYEKEYLEAQEEYETKLVVDLRNYLSIYSGHLFW